MQCVQHTLPIAESIFIFVINAGEYVDYQLLTTKYLQFIYKLTRLIFSFNTVSLIKLYILLKAIFLVKKTQFFLDYFLVSLIGT